jgi:hypothetical protein
MMRNGAVTQKFDFEIALMALGVDAAGACRCASGVNHVHDIQGRSAALGPLADDVCGGAVNLRRFSSMLFGP